MNYLKSFCLLTVAGGSLVTGTAAAQGQGGDNYYSRDKYEAVTERRQPAYDPEPIRLGTFLVNATGVVGATANSNVYAQENNEESDVIARIGGELVGVTNWSVHELGFEASAYRNEYMDLSDESANEFHGAVRGRLDATRDLSFSARVYADKDVEQRYSPATTGGLAKPIEYTTAGAEVSADYQNDRFRWNNSVGLRDWNFKDGRIIGTNAVADQDFRDRQTTYGRTRLSYAVSPDLAVFGQGTFHDEAYDQTQLIGGALRTRDSNGYTLSVGADFELTSLVRGDVAVGYLSENKDDNYFADVDGLSLDGRLQWFPSRLTTFTLTGSRRVVDTGVFDSPSAVATDFLARVDHELRRNIILSAEAGLTTYDFKEIDRKDDNSVFGVSARYKMNKHAHLNAFARHLDRDSSGMAGALVSSYGINLIGVELRLHP